MNKNENDVLVVSGPSFFINFPNENTRKYTWHSEQNWYPKRRNFLNVWCPIIIDRDNDNSMELKKGTHEKDWTYFSEYTGYNGIIDPNANVQYEIPENLKDNAKLIHFIKTDPRNQNGKIYCEIYDKKFLHYRGGGNWERRNMRLHVNLTLQLRDSLLD